MKLTKQQREARRKVIQKASREALRAHFTGDGATARRLRFVWGGLIASAGWTARIMFVASWAVIGGLLAGPEHDFFLSQVHAWMVATPVDQVLAQTHKEFLFIVFECTKIGLIVGFVQKLFAIASPAIEQAKQQFVLA